MTDLLDRLKKATGGDRGLDAEIFRATGKAPKEGPGPFDWKYQPGLGEWHQSDFNQPAPPLTVKAPAFTANVQVVIDMLVPEDCMWDVGSDGPDGGPWACVTNAESVDFSAHAPTPALALCVACGRARGW